MERGVFERLMLSACARMDQQWNLSFHQIDPNTDLNFKTRHEVEVVDSTFYHGKKELVFSLACSINGGREVGVYYGGYVVEEAFLPDIYDCIVSDVIVAGIQGLYGECVKKLRDSWERRGLKYGMPLTPGECFEKPEE